MSSSSRGKSEPQQHPSRNRRHGRHDPGRSRRRPRRTHPSRRRHEPRGERPCTPLTLPPLRRNPSGKHRLTCTNNRQELLIWTQCKRSTDRRPRTRSPARAKSEEPTNRRSRGARTARPSVTNPPADRTASDKLRQPQQTARVEQDTGTHLHSGSTF